MDGRIGMQTTGSNYNVVRWTDKMMEDLRNGKNETSIFPANDDLWDSGFPLPP